MQANYFPEDNIMIVPAGTVLHRASPYVSVRKRHANGSYKRNNGGGNNSMVWFSDSWNGAQPYVRVQSHLHPTRQSVARQYAMDDTLRFLKFNNPSVIRKLQQLIPDVNKSFVMNESRVKRVTGNITGNNQLKTNLNTARALRKAMINNPQMFNRINGWYHGNMNKFKAIGSNKQGPEFLVFNPDRRGIRPMSTGLTSPGPSNPVPTSSGNDCNANCSSNYNK